VAATRGRESNRLHVDVEPEPPRAEASHGRPERLSARQVLMSVAHRRGAEASGHPVMASEWAVAESLEQLVAEHESLVFVANSLHWEKALAGAGLPADALDVVRRSPEWGRLVRGLDHAEGSGAPVGVALPKFAALLGAAADPVATLQAVSWHWEGPAESRPPGPGQLVAGSSQGPKVLRTRTSQGQSANVRRPSPGAPEKWPKKPYRAGRSGPSPSGLRPATPSLPRPGGSASASSLLIATVGT
jgi:hypothetical protein